MHSRITRFNYVSYAFLIILETVVIQSAEHSTPDRWSRVRNSLAEAPPCMLMVPGACKISHGCIILQVPIQIMPLEILKRGSHALRRESKL